MNLKKGLDLSKKHSGKSKSVNPQEVVAWKEIILPSLTFKYAPKDIFNVAYSITCFDRTYTFNGEMCKGIKGNKISILACTNVVILSFLSWLWINQSNLDALKM
jgi:hypothetical protein